MTVKYADLLNILIRFMHQIAVHSFSAARKSCQIVKTLSAEEKESGKTRLRSRLRPVLEWTGM